jgi:hypothetical protein
VRPTEEPLTPAAQFKRAHSKPGLGQSALPDAAPVAPAAKLESEHRFSFSLRALLRRVPGRDTKSLADHLQGEAADAEIRPASWQRHDALVIIGALTLFALGASWYRVLTAPQLSTYSQLGLSMQRPTVFLPPRNVARVTERLAAVISRDQVSDRQPEIRGELPYHAEMQSAEEPINRLEVHIMRRPLYKNWRGALALGRASRYGETYWAGDSVEETIDNREWVKTTFRYAYIAHIGDVPKMATGIEYATLNGNLLYVVTFHGSDEEAERLAVLLAPTLSVDTDHPAAEPDKTRARP